MSSQHPVKRLRLQRLWTQRDLAEKAGVSHMTIWCIETGRTTDPSDLTLHKIANALGVDVAELQRGAEAA